MPSSAQASLGSAGTAVGPGRPPCDAVHPPVTSAHIIWRFIMTPGGRWPSWGERREIAPLVLTNSHPLSPQAFPKNPLCPLHQHGSAAGSPSGQARFGDWLRSGSFQEMGSKAWGIKQPLPWYRTLSALCCSCLLDLSPNQA